MQRLKSLTLVAVVLIAALSSCNYNKRLSKWCARCTIKDSVSFKEVIKLHDTTLYITQDGPVQYLENPCANLCDSLGNLKHFEIKKKENGIVGTIKSVGNSIAFDCADDSLKAIIKGLKEKTLTKSEIITRIEACQKEHRNWWDYFCRWFTGIIGGALIAYFGWRLIKLYLFKK